MCGTDRWERETAQSERTWFGLWVLTIKKGIWCFFFVVVFLREAVDSLVCVSVVMFVQMSGIYELFCMHRGQALESIL